MKCRLFHDWGCWHDKTLIEEFLLFRITHLIQGQERECKRCHKKELRAP